MKLPDAKLGLPIWGIVGSEKRDIQGEILDVSGADISDLQSGLGVWNSDHRNGFHDVVGRVTDAKKIFGPEDCKDEMELQFWNKVKAPLILASGYLYDQDGEHRGAQAVSAILRNQMRADSPLKLRASVEGGVVERGEKDSRILKRTKISRVALTFQPANNTTLIETPALTKSISKKDEELIKSLVPFISEDVPSFIDIADEIMVNRIQQNIKTIHLLSKALTAGYGGGSPTSQTGGLVLQSEGPVKREFSYVSCPECGKDQVHHAYQTKCRHCSKAFPFETLAKLFVK